MCGIVGVVSTTPVNQLIYDALLLLQHRGQDAAGIVTQQGRKFFMHKAKGMVRDVFRTRNMRALPGNAGLGQVRYPTAGNGGRWENWVTGDDVDSLLKWEEVFGSGYRAVFVFAYDVAADRLHEFEERFEFRRRSYAFFGVSACDYGAVMTGRSSSWETFSVARRPFAALRSPIEKLLHPAPVRPAP